MRPVGQEWGWDWKKEDKLNFSFRNFERNWISFRELHFFGRILFKFSDKFTRFCSPSQNQDSEFSRGDLSTINEVKLWQATLWVGPDEASWVSSLPIHQSNVTSAVSRNSSRQIQCSLFTIGVVKNWDLWERNFSRGISIERVSAVSGKWPMSKTSIRLR